VKLINNGGNYMDVVTYLILFAIAGFILFLIIAVAVKMAVREALLEFKDEIIKELNQRKSSEE
jgi:hypothetical protein